METINIIHKKLIAICLVAISMLGYAGDSDAPSMEFLEFLAEFSDVDDDDFEIFVFHALEDSEGKPETQKMEGIIVEDKIAEKQVVEKKDDE